MLFKIDSQYPYTSACICMCLCVCVCVSNIHQSICPKTQPIPKIQQQSREKVESLKVDILVTPASM